MSFDTQSFKQSFLRELPWGIAVVVLTLLYTWLFVKATGVAIIVMIGMIITMYLYLVRILVCVQSANKTYTIE